MAVIGTIRKQSGLLVIIVGIALAAFVLGDFLSPRNRNQKFNIAEVLGEELPYSQFDARFEQNLEFQKRNQNKENLTADEIFQLKMQTYDQLVQQIILEKEYSKLGLQVTAEEMFDQIQGENAHAYIQQYFKNPQTDQYDPELVRNYLSQLNQMDAATRQQWDVFVEAIKEDRKRTKYKNLISKGYFMPDTFLVSDFNEKKIQADVRLVALRYSSLADSLVSVTQSDLKKYYEDYKQNYSQEDSRDLNFVVFNVVPSANDRKKIRDDVYAIFEDFKNAENVELFVNSESENRYDSTFFKPGVLPIRIDSVVFNSPVGTFVEPYMENNAWHMAKLVDIQFRPDSMKASHILIAFAGAFRAEESVKRSKSAASNLADSLATILKTVPDKMESFASEFSDDPSAEQNKGDLGWFADGSMVYPFNNAVLTHKVGDIAMVETQFGFHVIKVTGKLEASNKARVAVIDISVTPSQETYQQFYAQASEFQGKATSLVAFDTLATSMGLTVRNATNIQPMTNRIAGVEYPRPIVQWAFIDGIKTGSVSHVFTMEDYYVVAAVTKERKEGIPSLEEIKETLEPLVLNDLKGKVAVEKIRSAMQGTTDLNIIARNLNTKVDSVKNLTFTARNIAGYGNESNVISKVFTMEAGKLSNPVKGNNNAFVFVVDQFKYPDQYEDNKIYKRQLLMNFRAKVNNNSYLEVLEKEAKVTDNRVQFF